MAHGLDATVERAPEPCHPCARISVVPPDSYAYLLGLYLGDGCLSASARNVYKLRIVLDVRYPGIISECRAAMEAVCPNRVGHAAIALQPWQRRIAVDAYPELLLRGLIHSDGCRLLNRVGGGYEYPRYQFSNRSAGIRAIFVTACGAAGVACRQSSQWHVSISRRVDVDRMDALVGPKY